MKKIFGISLIIASLVLVSCGESTQIESQNTADAVEVASSDDSVGGNKSTKEECLSGCKMMWKSNEGNKDRTGVDMDKDCNNLCEAGQGMQNDDISSCDKSEGILKDTCYSKIAKSKKDASLCAKIESKMFVNACYTDVAKETNDATLCDKISDKFFREVCTDQFKQQ